MHDLYIHTWEMSTHVRVGARTCVSAHGGTMVERKLMKTTMPMLTMCFVFVLMSTFRDIKIISKLFQAFVTYEYCVNILLVYVTHTHETRIATRS